MMEGSAVTPFAITYRKKMTGEFGFPRSDGYNLWENFNNQMQENFSILHSAQKALRDMEKVRYEGDIKKYLRTLEKLNIEAEMSGVASWNMIERRLPLEARRRWALKKFDLYLVFVEAVRRCNKAEESFKEQLGLEKTTITYEKRDGEVEKEIRILLSRKTSQNQAGIKSEKTTRQRKKDYMQKKGTRRQKGITKEK